MSFETTIQVPDGFYPVHRENVVEPEEARSLVRRKRTERFTAFRRRGDDIVLTEDRIRCPFCGSETPAYAAFHGAVLEEKKPRVGVRSFERWADPQRAIPGFVPDEYRLNNVWIPAEEYTCPVCGQDSTPLRRSRTVHIRARRGRADISWDSASLKRVLRSSHFSGRTLTLTPPLSETVTFDMKKGRVVLRVTDAAGNLAAVRDLTGGRDVWEESSVYRLIAASDAARQQLFLAFREAWGRELPFEEKDLTPELFTAATRFVGFPRDFYDAVPYDLETGRIEKSFRAVSRRLHSADALPELYGASGLPGMKSVKRALFSRPGLFFYLEEAGMLWEAVGDPNIFCRLLDIPRIYDVMSFLHRFPDCLAFFRDYVRERGGPGMLRLLSTRWDRLQGYIAQYSIMRPSSRAEERRKWRGDAELIPGDMNFSIPMQYGDHDIADCCVDGYRFSWLRSRADFRAAGEALNNCLISWQSTGNPVVAVKRDGRYVAAVEVSDGMVVQARSADNQSMESVPSLNAAYLKWLDKFHLVQRPFLDLFDDDIPF